MALAACAIMLRTMSLALLVALGSFACDGDAQSTGGGGAGGESDGGGGSGGDGGSGGGVEPPQGLFECGLPLTCGDFTQHAGSVSGGQPDCVAQVAYASGVGSAIYRDSPGPYISVTESLVIYTGDGFATLQTRHKDCMCTDDIPWEAPGPIQRCEVALPADVQAACDADDVMECVALPLQTLTNCVPVSAGEEPTCAELLTVLSD